MKLADYTKAQAENMRFRKSLSRHNNTIPSRGFIECIDEIFYQIIADVDNDDDDPFSLLSLSLTCRRLYVLCIPTLYRSITIDISRWSHQCLIQRLIRPNSQLPGMIRTLSIQNTDKSSEMRLLDLYILCSRLTHLVSFSWQGALYIPHYIMEHINRRFPRATFNLDATTLPLGVSASSACPPYTILTHPTGTQLTRFEFNLSEYCDVSARFKEHLITMLKRNKVLTYLRLHDENSNTPYLREYRSLFSSGTFPPLRDLYLTADIFSRRELHAWGARNGWSKLRCLRVHRVRQLRPILLHAENLEELFFYPIDHTEAADLHIFLDHANNPAVTSLNLSSVRKISYKAFPDPNILFPDPTNPPRPDQSPIPWALIALTPQLEDLSIYRARFDFFLPGPELYVPTAADVAQLRSTCPGLKNLELDIRLQGRWGTWPVDIIDEIALFEEAMRITLFVHVLDTRLNVVREALYARHLQWIFQRIVERRKERGLSCAAPFELRTKLVKIYEEMGEMWCVPDYAVWLDSSERVRVFGLARWMGKEVKRGRERERMDGLTARQLDEENGKGVKEAWRRGREIARRNKKMQGNGRSLYDVLMEGK